MSNTKDILKNYQDYKPEIVEYNEEIDGGLMPVREKHLDEKELLKNTFEKKRDKLATKITAR